MSHKAIILASQSLIRRQLLQASGVEFDWMSADVDEKAFKESQKSQSFNQLALVLAREKAKAISLKYPKAQVIGSDTLCVFKELILSKPGNFDKAIEQLSLLQGNTHHLITAVSLYQQGVEIWHEVDEVELTMQSMNHASIKEYVLLDEPYESCGSYYYERNGKHLFSDVKGSVETILGLPTHQLLNQLDTVI